MTAKNIFQLQGQNDHTATYGEQGDISNICQFRWYEWVYVRYGSEPFPLMTEVLGHCLETAKHEGNEMAQWILKINGQVVPRKSLRKLRPNELANESEIAKRAAFDASIKIKHGDSFTVPDKEFLLNPQDPWDEEEHPTLGAMPLMIAGM